MAQAPAARRSAGPCPQPHASRNRRGRNVFGGVPGVMVGEPAGLPGDGVDDRPPAATDADTADPVAAGVAAGIVDPGGGLKTVAGARVSPAGPPHPAERDRRARHLPRRGGGQVAHHPDADVEQRVHQALLVSFPITWDQPDRTQIAPAMEASTFSSAQPVSGRADRARAVDGRRDFRKCDLCTMAADEPGLLEPAKTRPARRRRQVDEAGRLCPGEAPLRRKDRQLPGVAFVNGDH